MTLHLIGDSMKFGKWCMMERLSWIITHKYAFNPFFIFCDESISSFDKQLPFDTLILMGNIQFNHSMKICFIFE